MEFKDFLKKEQCLKFLKWVEIIQQEDKAVRWQSMYILERDKKYCDVIIVDDAGNKRRIGRPLVYFTNEDVVFSADYLNEIYKDSAVGDIVINKSSNKQAMKISVNEWSVSDVEIL